MAAHKKELDYIFVVAFFFLSKKKSLFSELFSSSKLQQTKNPCLKAEALEVNQHSGPYLPALLKAEDD